MPDNQTNPITINQIIQQTRVRLDAGGRQQEPVGPAPLRDWTFDRNVVVDDEAWGAATAQAREIAEDIAALKVKKEAPTAPLTIAQQYGLRVPSSVAKVIDMHKGKPVMGVELEIENFPVHLEDAAATGFVFTSDGSLRNNGIEAVSRPNSVEGLLTVVKDLWSKFNITNDNFSDRTSIHVHCNVTHFQELQIKTLVLLYPLFEDIFFDIVDAGIAKQVGADKAYSRRDNIFCVPWCEASLHVGNYMKVWTRPKQWQKYTSLNLIPIATQGTVEFRHMHGHCDFELFSNWMRLLEDFMLAAEKLPAEETYKRVINLNTSSEYTKFLYDVFPNMAPFIEKNVPQWEHHMIRGVVEAKLSVI